MQKTLTTLLFLFGILCAKAQPYPALRIRVLDAEKRSPLHLATVQLFNSDSVLLHSVVTDSNGLALFTSLKAGSYRLQVSRTDYEASILASLLFDGKETGEQTILMSPATGVLGNVLVQSRKPMVQFLPDRTVLNVEATISNAGSTVLEVLERAPGVSTDRDGNISLKGKPGVLILIDGKPTQLAGMDLQNLLAGMSSSQVETIELIDNPSAKYDAAGNAGIINIRTKKNKQRGFNGNLSLAYGRGQLPKNNNSLNLNFRQGRFNFFLGYSSNLSSFMMDMDALRTYFNPDRSVSSYLEQPFYTETRNRMHQLNAGFDFYVNSKTTIGLALNGMLMRRRSITESNALWMNPQKLPDSIIYTNSLNTNRLDRGGATLNLRHVFNSRQEISIDLDWLDYEIVNRQIFENRTGQPTAPTDDASRGDIPSSLAIFSGKVDYTQQFKNLTWESGWKSSRVETDNLAVYEASQGGPWVPDLGKSNHFLYTENIHALYTNANLKKGKWNLQAGLRYEYTGYRARQLGNAQVADSSFNRNYGNLFPSIFLTYELDSINSITVRAGRRIDRPAFQKLNPFTFIINKYTFQQGNPYFQPQFTWNLELTHQYKQALTTTFSYNLIRDYISQVFYEDTSTGLIVYTEGNIGEMRNLGLSVSAQLSPASWWSVSMQGTGNHKRIEAQLWRRYVASIWQANFSINNQFRFRKGWGAELSGFYITRNQNDIQEVLEPTGQVSIGLSKQILKNAGTIRLSFRDIFWTQNMAGLTDFQFVEEYFHLQRDTRVFTVAFSWRFGKAMKQTARRNTGAAGDIIERVGTN